MDPIQFTAEDLLAIEDIPFEDVVIPEWQGATIRVMGMSAEAASAFSKKLVKVDNKGKVQSINIENTLAELVALTAYNVSGMRIFDSEEKVKALGKKSAAVLKRLGDVASRLSGLDERAVEDAEKN